MRQWISPIGRRHFQGFSEAVSSILQAESSYPSHWLVIDIIMLVVIYNDSITFYIHNIGSRY